MLAVGSVSLQRSGGAVQGAVEARNRDYAAIVRNLKFVNKGWYDTQIQADEEAEVRRKVGHANCHPCQPGLASSGHVCL